MATNLDAIIDPYLDELNLPRPEGLTDRLLDRLTERELRVTKMRLGIAPYVVPMTLDEVADILELYAEEVEQIQAEATRKIGPT